MVASTAKRHILRELLDGPKSVREMREEDGSPVDTEDLDFDPDIAMKLTTAGREMLFVSFVLERWLHSSPLGPLQLGSEGANEATAGLVCAWASTLMHTLALGPLDFPTLNHSVETLDYRSLEAHIDVLEETGQVEPRSDEGGTTRYAVTDWLRHGIAPLAAAARLERHNESKDAAPIDHLDVGASFLLTLPLLELPAGVGGACQLGVELDNGELVGATAQVERGRVIECELGLDRKADAWATGSAGEWLDTVIEPGAHRVRTGGEERLAATLLDGLHETLFGIPVR